MAMPTMNVIVAGINTLITSGTMALLYGLSFASSNGCNREMLTISLFFGCDCRLRGGDEFFDIGETAVYSGTEHHRYHRMFGRDVEYDREIATGEIGEAGFSHDEAGYRAATFIGICSIYFFSVRRCVYRVVFRRAPE